MAEVSGREAHLRYTSVTGTSSTNEACTRTTGAGSANGYVQINSTAKRHWDRDSTGFRLYRIAGGSTTLVGSSQYDINYVQGKFEYRSGDPSTGTYQADVIYLTDTYLTGGRSWTLDMETDMLDVTSFATSTGNVTWREFVPGISQASGTISRLISTGDTGPVYYDRLNTETDFIAEFIMTDRTRFEGYARVEADGWETAPDDLTAESVTLRIDGPLYYSTT